jgi:hypothetical protein
MSRGGLVGKQDETPEFLAVAQILRSKRRAAALLKGLRGQDFGVILKAAKEYKKEVQSKRDQLRSEATLLDPRDQEEQRENLYVMRTLALSSFPHSPCHVAQTKRSVRLGATSWVDMTQTARAFDDGIELPFGKNARRVFMLICTLAVKKGSPLITLDTAVDFMRQMKWQLASADGKYKGISQNRYDSLSSILESFQKMTLDLEYKGAISKRGRVADSFQIIKRFHLPKKGEDGQAGLFQLDKDNEDEHIGPPGTFWFRMDKDFYEELTGTPERGIQGNAFPFKADYIDHFNTSKEIDVALFLAARCAAAETTSRPIDLHDIWDQLAIDPSNYSMFKKVFVNTLERVRNIWDGCRAYVPEGSHSLIIEPVPPGKEMVERALADTILSDFLSRETPEERGKQYLQMRTGAKS